MGIDVTSILLGSVEGIIRLMSMAGLGVLMTRWGFLTPQTAKGLSILSMNLLLPAYMFTAVFNCNCGNGRGDNQCVPIVPLIRASSFLLLWPLVVVAVGLFLGWILVVCARTPNTERFSGLRESVRAAVMFSNATTWPILLFTTVTPTLIKAGVLTSDPNQYLPIYLVLDPMLKWAVGGNLFGLSESREEEERKGTVRAATIRKATVKACETPRVPELEDGVVPELAAGETTRSGQPDREGETDDQHTESRRHGFYLPLDLDMAFEADLGAASPDDESDEEDVARRTTRRTARRTAAGPRRHTKAATAARNSSGNLCKRALKVIHTVMKNALVPPVTATLFGLALGALISVPQFDAGFAPLWPLWSRALWPLWKGVKLMGDCMVPINLLSLGASVAQGAEWDRVPIKTNIGSMLTKMFCIPVVCTGLVWVCIRVLPPAATAAWFVALVVPIVPTANQISVMVEVSGRDKKALSMMILSQLIVAPISLCFWLTVFPVLLQQEWFLPADKRGVMGMEV